MSDFRYIFIEVTYPPLHLTVQRVKSYTGDKVQKQIKFPRQNIPGTFNKSELSILESSFTNQRLNQPFNERLIKNIK